MTKRVDYGDCTLVACVKSLEEGYVRFKFYEPITDTDIFVNIPIEYYLMATGKRKWNTSLDENGDLKKKK